MSERLYQIRAPRFVAGFAVRGGRIVAAPPIIYWMKGKSFTWVQSYCRRMNWKIERAGAAG